MSKPSKPLQFPTPKEYYADQNDIQKNIQSLHTKIESTSKSDLKWLVSIIGGISFVGLNIIGIMFWFLWNNFDKHLTGIEIKIDKTEQMTEAKIDEKLQKYEDHTTQQIMDIKKILQAQKRSVRSASQ